MPKPKILVISNYSGSLNAIRPECEIFLGLIKNDFDITVMTPEGEFYPEKFKAAGAKVIDAKPQAKIDLKFINLLRQTVKDNNIDIVHCFNSRAISNTTIALWRSSVKIVGYRGYTGNIHWYDPALYLTFLSPRIDYMICLAPSVREMFLNNGMPDSKAVTIHKGHSPDWYADIEAANLDEFNIPSGSMVCSFVANYRTKMKGLHHLIEATKHLDEKMEIYILLIGQGMDTEEIKGLIQNSPRPERFIFTGFRNNASSICRACDISISVSLFGEATQKAMIEAMFLGNPVIISDIPGNRGMVEHGIGGYIVPPADPISIAKALNNFYSDRSSIPQMGLAAKSHIESFLSNEKTIKEYGEFYERISN